MKQDFKIYILIIALGAALFLPFLGSAHLFDWDEINFAEASREMLATGDFLSVRIDYKPFHEKPPMFFWLQAASMSVFGVNEYAARLPNAVIGIISLLVLYHIGKRLYDKRFGLIWTLTYCGSLLPFFYFKFGIIDPTFNLLMFLSVFFISKIYESPSANKKNSLILAGFFSALAVLTKGPVGLLMPGLVWFVYWFFNRRRCQFPIKQMLLFALISLIPSIAWYSYVFISSGSNVVELFIDYQLRLFSTSDGGHGGTVLYHPFVLLVGCFPASIFLLRAFRLRLDDNERQQNFKQWVLFLLLVVVIVFSFVGTKIIHYSSLAYFPLTYLAAYTVYSLSYRGMQPKRSTIWLLGIFGFIVSAAFIAVPLLFLNISSIAPLIDDKFTREVLTTPVHWGGWEAFPGIMYLCAIAIGISLIIKKKYLQGAMTLYSATALLMFIAMPILMPRIEAYTQGEAIKFFQSKQGCDCYVHVIDISNYKFSHLFYSQKPPSSSSVFNKNIPNDDLEQWLLDGDIDKPAYFISKASKTAELMKNPELILLETKHGFAFWQRNPKN